MALTISSIILAFTIVWSGYAAHRLWIGPAIKRHRVHRAVKRLGVRAYVW